MIQFWWSMNEKLESHGISNNIQVAHERRKKYDSIGLNNFRILFYLLTLNIAISRTRVARSIKFATNGDSMRNWYKRLKIAI